MQTIGQAAIFVLPDGLLLVKTQDHLSSEWSRQWFLGFRQAGRSSDKRTCIVSAFPRYPALGTIQTVYFEEFHEKIICFLANLSSLMFDYIVRNKTSGTSLTKSMIEQIPVFPPEVYSERLLTEIKERVLPLVYTSWDMQPFAQDFGILEGIRPIIWNSKQRHILMAELDAIFALMYGVDRNELDYILDTFFVLREKELRRYGEYRTKRLVMRAFGKFLRDPELGPIYQLQGVNIERLSPETPEKKIPANNEV